VSQIQPKKPYLVKIVFVELPNEGSKIGVLEHFWEDGFGELVHVFDYETISIWTPRDHRLKRGVLEHFEELLDKIGCRREVVGRCVGTTRDSGGGRN
jgi:hypothetical protein